LNASCRTPLNEKRLLPNPVILRGILLLELVVFPLAVKTST